MLVAAELDRHLRVPLREVLWGDDEESAQVRRSSLSRRCSRWRWRCCELLRCWGVRPDFVMGHSVGEIDGGVCGGGVDVG